MKYKKRKPVISFLERVEILQSVSCVDTVVAQESMDKMKALNELKFNIMFVGNDWQGTEKWNKIEADMVKKNVKIIYFPYTKTTSSTIIKEILENYK